MIHQCSVERRELQPDVNAQRSYGSGDHRHVQGFFACEKKRPDQVKASDNVDNLIRFSSCRYPKAIEKI